MEKIENYAEVRESLGKMKLCDRCLGRQFAMVYKGNDNAVIGANIRAAKTQPKKIKTKVKVKLDKKCPLCLGLFGKLPGFSRRVLELLQNYDFETFLCGCTLDPALIAKEEELWSDIGAAHCESVKKDIVREIGMQIEKKLKKKVEFNAPDIQIVFDFPADKLKIQLNPLYVYGEYEKLVRGIPQTTWYCRECQGKGCAKCNHTGKMYQESIQSLIAAKVLEATGGSDNKFHGSGREDIDALMVGGRPFVLEISEPITRKMDLKKLEKEINKFAKGKVKVSCLRYTNKEEVRLLKSLKNKKVYRVKVECDSDISEDVLKYLEPEFKNKIISQRTPVRVSHRRADLVRKREVIYVKTQFIDARHFEAEIETEAGTYIKELINGDDGRTLPSFASVFGFPCKCTELDVLEVKKTKAGEACEL